MEFTVLLVEDNKDIRENAAELLELEGYTIMAASNGELALEMVAARKPDLIICDVVMPGISGYDVFAALQNDETTRAIPFIFATAQSERADLDKAMALGICHYLIKPYDEVELLCCIEACRQKG